MMSAFATLLLVLVVAPSAFGLENGPTCSDCLDGGYSYLCSATIVDGGCLENAGMARCWGNRCSCCKHDPEGSAECTDCLLASVDQMPRTVADVAELLEKAVADEREPPSVDEEER